MDHNGLTSEAIRFRPFPSSYVAMFTGIGTSMMDTIVKLVTGQMGSTRGAVAASGSSGSESERKKAHGRGFWRSTTRITFS